MTTTTTLTCRKCLLTKPSTDFYASLPSRCKDCHKAEMHRRFEYNPVLARQRVLKRYELDQARYDALLEAQGGGCAICGKTDPGSKPFHIDHDHSCCPGRKSCGKCVRRLLCNTCNTALGHIESDRYPKFLAYLGWIS